MSEVWNFFQRDSNSTEPDRAQCLSCGKNYAHKTGTTGGMRRHLERKHPVKYKELLEMELKRSTRPVPSTSGGPPTKQAKLTTMFPLSSSGSFWEDSNLNSKILDQRILELICLDNQPFTILEDTGFQRLMQAAAPRYRLKSEKFYRERLPELYNSVKQEVKKIVCQAQDMSFTCDIWSEGKLALISLTAHFLTATMERMQFVLSVTPFLDSHTGINIANILSQLLESWEIDRGQVHLLLRDGASNMKLAGQTLGVDTAHCAAHKLNLIVKEGLASQVSVKKLVDKSRSIAGHFRHSATAQQNLRVIQQQLQLPLHCLEQDVETRWNSTLIMLRRLNEQEASLVLYNTRHRALDMLTNSEWELSRKATNLLEIFELFTLEVSKSAASVSCIVPLVTKTLQHLRSLEADVSGINTMRETLINSLETRFSDELLSEKHLVASVLDPRFKLEFFGSEEVQKRALDATHAALSAAELKMESTSKSLNPPQGTSLGSASSANASRLSFSNLFDKSEGHSNLQAIAIGVEGAAATSSRRSLQEFLLEPRVSFETDPVAFWKMRCWTSDLEPLKAVVLQYLSAPPSSVPSERIFSQVGNIYQPRRRCLKGESVEKLLFVCCNLPLVGFKY